MTDLKQTLRPLHIGVAGAGLVRRAAACFDSLGRAPRGNELRNGFIAPVHANGGPATDQSWRLRPTEITMAKQVTKTNEPKTETTEQTDVGNLPAIVNAPVANAPNLLERLNALKEKEATNAERSKAKEEAAAKLAEINAMLDGLKHDNGQPLNDAEKAMLRNDLLGKEGNGRKSVVPAKFAKIYNAQGGNNGDGLATIMKNNFEDAKTRQLDLDKFVTWGRNNGFGDAIDRYIAKGLNKGMIRMNVVNMVRHQIREEGKTFIVFGTEVSRKDLKKS